METHILYGHKLGASRELLKGSLEDCQKQAEFRSQTGWSNLRIYTINPFNLVETVR